MRKKAWTLARLSFYFVHFMPNPKFEDNRKPNDRTLRGLVDDRLALFFECASCQRLSQSDILELVWRFGPDIKVETVLFRAVCSRCNARSATPLLKSVYRRGDFTWSPQPPLASR
jgi:hypothetical protein